MGKNDKIPTWLEVINEELGILLTIMEIISQQDPNLDEKERKKMKLLLLISPTASVRSLKHILTALVFCHRQTTECNVSR